MAIPQSSIQSYAFPANVASPANATEIPFAYLAGNTSVTDGYPAYEGPGVSQNQSMPQYILVVMSAPYNTTASITIGGKVYFSSVLHGNPQVYPVYTSLMGVQSVNITFRNNGTTYMDSYTVSFMLVATFIKYEQTLHPAPQVTGISEASLGTDIVWAFVMVIIGFVARHGISRLRWMRKQIDNFFR